MSSGPISVQIIAGDNAISKWRTMLGPTKVLKAQYEATESIRGRFGVTDTRNVGHGSDSLSSALKEISFFFPDFCYETWCETEKPLFITKNVTFCPEKCISVPNKR